MTKQFQFDDENIDITNETLIENNDIFVDNTDNDEIFDNIKSKTIDLMITDYKDKNIAMKKSKIMICFIKFNTTYIRHINI